MVNGSSEEPQTGRLYGIRRTLSRLGETLNNFWYRPSEYEVARGGVDRVYQAYRSEEVKRMKERIDPDKVREYRRSKGWYRRKNKPDKGIEKGDLTPLTRERRKEIREHFGVDELRLLRSEKKATERAIEYKAAIGEISTRRRSRITYAMSALDSVAQIGQYIARVLPVLVTLRNEYVDRRQQGQIQDLYRRAESLPRPDEVSGMSYEQLEQTMRDVQQLKTQMEQIAPVLYQILQRMDEEKPQEQTVPEEPVQEEKPQEKVAAVASISALTLGLLTLTRGRTIFTIKASQNKGPISLVLLLILVISLFVLNKIQRKKK